MTIHKETMLELERMVNEEDWGALTTGMCKHLGVSMDQFLIYAQMPKHNKGNIIRALFLNLMTMQYGHCSQ